MAIIKVKGIKNKQNIATKVNQEILQQIEQYCEWAGIYDLGFFIEEAAHYVFRKDKEWKEYKESKL
jgi:hypothetical protein